ncbi:C39 family peptidase [Deinococcus frigens]|uniref:C39 family peptidase n=1 Tax=Deinococcus frigens TaxID=249403 RepID=UPI00068A92C0|nr:C39 family peptidase [Deinococcus frigens]
MSRVLRHTVTDFHQSLSASGLNASNLLNLADSGLSHQAGEYSGTFISPVITPLAPFYELLPTWNALTPMGTSIEFKVCVRIVQTWSTAYSFGRWTSRNSPERTSQGAQADEFGEVQTDVLVLRQPANAYQYHLSLYTQNPILSPEVTRLVFTTISATPRPSSPVPMASSAWGMVLPVVPRSQMLYPGGQGWCSPTSMTMLLEYWGLTVSVPEAARATYDAAYKGTGNWAFNAAFAASLGFCATATRYDSFTELEHLISQRVPVAISIGWEKGELPSAPIPRSPGHLVVLRGFDRTGQPIVNDPGAATDGCVRRTYPRARLEALWLRYSGGLTYVIHPPHLKVS